MKKIMKRIKEFIESISVFKDSFDPFHYNETKDN